jgi:small subunit ribosomal protein S24e
MFHVTDENCVVVFGFKTEFGGGKSVGSGRIYENVGATKKYELRYRLVRMGLATKKEGARKQIKEKKNRAKKFRGLKKFKAPKQKKEK